MPFMPAIRLNVNSSYFQWLSIVKLLGGFYLFSINVGLVSSVLWSPLHAQHNDISLKVGIYNNPPLIYFSEKGQVKGFFADLIKHIAKKEGWNITYVPGSFKQLLTLLETKQIALMPVVAYSDERARQFDFSQQNVLTNWAQIYTAEGSTIKSLPDLAQKKIAVLKKDIHYSVFNRLMEQFGITSEIVETDSYDQVLKKVADHSVDAGITNRIFGNQFEYTYEVEKSGIVFNPIKIHFAFAKNEHAEILKKIDQYLVLLKKNQSSLYYTSIDKWLAEPVPVKSLLPVVLAIFLILAFIFYLFYMLIQLQPVRRALGLTEIIDEQVIINVLIVTLLIAALAWGLISWIDYLWFNPLNDGLTSFVFPVFDNNRIFYRVILVWGILLSGILISRIFLRLITSQQQIRQSEQRFHLTTRAGKTGVWDWNLYTNEVYLAPYLKQMLGYQDSDIHNHMDEWSGYVHPDDEEEVSAAVQRALDDRDQEYHVEHRMMHKDSNERWFLANGSVIRDVDGAPVRMVGTNTDITDLKQAELALRDSEARFRNLFENSEVSIWDEDLSEVYLALDQLKKSGVTDLRGYCEKHPDYVRDLAAGVKVNRVNAATLTLFNAQHENEFLSQIDTSFGPGAMDVLIDSLCAYWDNKSLFRSEANYKTLDGQSIQGFISYRIPDSQIGYKNIAITIVDISDRKQALQALVDNQELLKEAQAMAQIGNWELDPVTMKAVWSEEVFLMFGIEMTNDVGTDCLAMLLHEDDRERVLSALQRAITDGQRYHLEYRIKRPDGDIRWFDCQATQKYSDRGELLKLRGVIQDITERRESEKKLIFLRQQSEQSKRKFKAITDQSTEGITVADMDGNYTFVNVAFCNMVGYSEQELLQMSVYDVKAPDQDKSSFERTKGSDEGIKVEVYLQRKDGSVFISEVVGKVIEFDGQMQVLGSVRDITRQIKAEQQIRILSQAVEQSPVSVMITDTEAKIEYVNEAFVKVTGYSAAEVVGLNPRFLQSGNTPSSFFHEIWQAIRGGKNWKCELQNRKKNGELFWECAHFSPVFDEYGKIAHYLSVKEDITLRRQQEEHIIHQAHFDTLTNLPNRFLALDRLTQLMQEARRENHMVAVLFLDLDDFKKVNDTLGHETGDKLLIEASERLSNIIRGGDTVGRFGGDEFIVLLGGLSDSSGVQPVVDNLLNRFREAFCIDGRELMLTLSIGIAIYPGDGDHASELLRNADSAMYHSKQLGRNTFSFFTDELNRIASHRLALEEQMHGALERGEFYVVYQPQIDINSGEIMGAEALLRWSNPALGDVSPVVFIPIAEQTGLIISLGKYVLIEALNKTSVWQRDFYAQFNIAVNLSPRQFRDPDLVEFIAQTMKQSSVNSDTVELEITEGVLMSGHGHVDHSLEKLNNLGVKISMDDFGTGYSSLSYLRSYPFNVLKIDKSFIQDITVDQADRELINATIAMSHGLQLKVVAEGVETEEQLQYLKKLGCDYAQGYLFSKPVPENQLTELLHVQKTEFAQK